MPNTRENLIELLDNFQRDLSYFAGNQKYFVVDDNVKVADYLIANGVTIPVRCMDCKHYTTGMAIGMCKRIPDKPIIPVPFNSFCLFGETIK